MIVLNLEPDGFSAEAIGEVETFARYRPLPPDVRRGDARFDALLADADVIWTRLAHRIDADLLDRAPRLRAVASATTGLNHVDTAACAVRGIGVVSLRGEAAFLSTITATAELTLSLMLECMRRTGRAHRSVVEEGVFDRDRFVGLQLAGRTLGIVGLGRLGSIVAEYGKALRMRVLFCDPRTDAELDPPAFATRVSFDALLAESDVVSLHASHSPGAARLFDAAAFARMRPGAVFVNTARGELVDEPALLDALRGGRLAAAAVDVLDDEVARAPLGLAHPLVAYAREAANLVVTPHIGGACRDAMAATECFVAKKLRAFLADPG
ncbi:NAD(P)-dependent oxidoreductase [Salinarimonas sp.]|uniref:NAD(P)-dependent oxidoreductase n=1 Tax=Salinarimonas sp. TaxID=2766526 RepID=UPI0032D972A9